jgi:hypothetical protein
MQRPELSCQPTFIHKGADVNGSFGFNLDLVHRNNGQPTATPVRERAEHARYGFELADKPLDSATPIQHLWAVDKHRFPTTKQAVFRKKIRTGNAVFGKSNAQFGLV